MKKALIFYGGWDGHKPDLCAKIFEKMLKDEGYNVDVQDNLECLADQEHLKSLNLIVPCWTMGTIENDYSVNVREAVATGVGVAGCHGGMCDSFRNDTEWQFMTGGQWVSHPGNDGVEYMVNIMSCSNPLVVGIKDFKVTSEQYYMHVDPAVEVLATTRFPIADGYHFKNKPVDMPVAWTKLWGDGKVFYTSLGHDPQIFVDSPEARELMRRGMLWSTK